MNFLTRKTLAELSKYQFNFFVHHGSFLGNRLSRFIAMGARKTNGE